MFDVECSEISDKLEKWGVKPSGVTATSLRPPNQFSRAAAVISLSSWSTPNVSPDLL